MATYRVTDPTTGRTIKLTGDSPPTEAELNQIFSSVAPAQAQSQQPQSSPSLLNQGWNALQIPEQKSREGLQMIAQAIPNPAPTGNLPLDLIKGTPRIAADTMAEVAPEFISRGSMVTAGALKGVKAALPAIRAVGRGAARAAESISGLEYKTPGVLKEVFNKPKLLFAPGKEKAEYEAAKKIGGEVRESLLQIPEKSKMVKKALQMAEKGGLNPTEALEARKELASIKKQVTGEFFRKATDKFNEIAKPVYGEADTAYKEGIKAEALRAVLPVNKGGGTSIAKTTLATFMNKALLPAMSPIVQGATAASLGAVAKAVAPIINAPAKSAAVIQVAKMVKKLTEDKAREYLRKAKGNKDKARSFAKEDGWEITK